MQNDENNVEKITTNINNEVIITKENLEDKSKVIDEITKISSTTQENKVKNNKFKKTKFTRNNQQNNDSDAKALSFATLEVKRIAKVTTGGRYFRVSVVAIAGDKAGNVGYGVGKAFDMSDAKRKAMSAARKSLRNFPLLENRTILHDVEGRNGAISVILRKAKPGTSIIASSKLFVLFTLLGIKDIVVKKVTGPSNITNLIEAVFNALNTTARTKFFKEIAEKEEARKLAYKA
ncbi:MAG: hypothetical protein U1E31_02695 [Rickettsiales bacterium]